MIRLWNLIKGLFRSIVGGIEQERPDLVYDNAIEAEISRYTKLKSAAAAVIRNANEAAEKYQHNVDIQKQITAQLDQAAKLPPDQVDMEAATFLTSQLDELTQGLSGLKTEAEAAAQDAKDVKEALVEVQGNIAKLKGEKAREVAKFHSAVARIGIREQLDGLSSDNNIKALDGVRNNIKNKISEAQLTQELASNSLDTRLNKFTKTTSNMSAKDNFLKRQAAAQGSAVKTL